MIVMKACLRETLANSHVAAVSIAILIFWCITSLFEAVWPWLARVGQFLLEAVAILDVPYFSTTFDAYDRSQLVVAGVYLYSAGFCLLAAWLLARWVYGKRPLQVLITYYGKLPRTNHA